MSIIDIGNAGFIINGTPSAFVVQTLKDAGLPNNKVAEIVGAWFVGVTGSTQPAPFDFEAVVQATDPNCVVDYTRRFAHTDFIDGETRVQAGITPEELGFNARFHALENEFDAISGQFVRLGRCVGELRGDLVGVVGELEQTITTMRNQIHALQKDQAPKTAPGIVGTAKVDEQDVLITKFGPDFEFVGIGRKPFGPPFPERTGGVVPAGVDPEVFDPLRLTPVDVIGATLRLDEVFTRSPLADLFEAKQPVTVSTLRRVGSTVAVPGAGVLGSILASMPADAAFRTPAEAVTAIIEHTVGALPEAQAGAIRQEVLNEPAVGRTGRALLGSKLTATGLDEQTAGVLAEAGFGTVGRLSDASLAEVAGALARAGLDEREAAGFMARARVAKAVRNIGAG